MWPKADFIFLPVLHGVSQVEHYGVSQNHTAQDTSRYGYGNVVPLLDDGRVLFTTDVGGSVVLG